MENYNGENTQANYTQQDNAQPNYNQPNYTQPNYNQAPVNNYGSTDLEEPVTMGEWLVSLLLLMIPCVNIVMMFVWAFGNGKKSKQNFFKAYLIYFAISVVLVILLYVFVFAAVIGMTNTSVYY